MCARQGARGAGRDSGGTALGTGRGNNPTGPPPGGAVFAAAPPGRRQDLIQVPGFNGGRRARGAVRPPTQAWSTAPPELERALGQG